MKRRYFALAALIEPLVRALVRRGWRRGIAAGLVSLGLLALLIQSLGALIAWLLGALSDFADRVPALMTGLAQGLGSLEERMLGMIAQAPEELESTLRLALDAMGQNLYGLPAVLSQWALDALRREVNARNASIAALKTADADAQVASSAVSHLPVG